jgi:hypothetical protein
MTAAKLANCTSWSTESESRKSPTILADTGSNWAERWRELTRLEAAVRYRNPAGNEGETVAR